MDVYIQQAHHIVTRQFQNYIKRYQEVGVLLSGGIDSSLISTYVLEHYPSTHIFSMGTEKTKDRKYTDIFAKQFKTRIFWLHLNESFIQEAIPKVRALLQKSNIEQSLMQISLAVGYYLLFKYVADQGVHTVITGQGPDILFAGYHKYHSVSLEKMNSEIQQDLSLLEIDKKRDKIMADAWDITLLNPYLEQEFVNFSLTVPSKYKRVGEVEKFFMREWGKTRKLPAEIVTRPKKAFQYSTGIHKIVQKLV